MYLRFITVYDKSLAAVEGDNILEKSLVTIHGDEFVIFPGKSLSSTTINIIIIIITSFFPSKYNPYMHVHVHVCTYLYIYIHAFVALWVVVHIMLLGVHV